MTNHIKITLDPGHVKDYNTGYISSYKEGTKMFLLAEYLKSALEKYGFDVVLTKTDVSMNPSLTDRGKLAVTNKSNVFISLHSDAYKDGNACGVSIYRSIKRPNSEGLCNKLGIAIALLMKNDTGNTYFRGTLTKESESSPGSDYLGVLRNSQISGSKVEYSILIEHGFHTNQKECAWLNDDNNLKRLANIEAEVLAEYFGLNTNNKTVETYEVIVDSIKGYNTASDAMNNINSKTSFPKGTYYIFKTYENGSINITKDKTGKVPGAWINPSDNKVVEINTDNLTAITMNEHNMPIITFDQALSFLNKKAKSAKINCSFEKLIYNYIKAGYEENIRWDIAFAQSIKETGYFAYGGQVKPEQNNYAGIGALNGGSQGASFDTPYLGILAQIQHLKAYANTEKCEKECVDPRFNLVTRGWSPYVEWLGLNDNPKNKTENKQIGWAVPGDGYGKSILDILNKIKAGE